MKTKTFLLIAIISFLFIACSVDDSYTCFTPPQEVVLELVDTQGQNLFENGTLNVDEIKIYEILEDGELKSHSNPIIKYNYRISIPGLGWFDGTKNYRFQSPLRDFDFSVVSHKLTGNCGGNVIDEINFSGVDVDDSHFHTEGYFVIIFN